MVPAYVRQGYVYLHDGAVRLKEVEFLYEPRFCWSFEGGWYNGQWRQPSVPYWLLKEQY